MKTITLPHASPLPTHMTHTHNTRGYSPKPLHIQKYEPVAPRYTLVPFHLHSLIPLWAWNKLYLTKGPPKIYLKLHKFILHSSHLFFLSIFFFAGQRKSNAYLDVPISNFNHLQVSDNDDEDVDRLRTFSTATKGGKFLFLLIIIFFGLFDSLLTELFL